MATTINCSVLNTSCNTNHQCAAPQKLHTRGKPWSHYQSRRSVFAGQGLVQHVSSSTRARVNCRSANKLAVTAETSYIMIKPDGVQRALVGEIIQRFERKGFTLKALKMFRPTKDLAEEHYKDLSSKPFFGKLVDYIISGPVIAMVSSQTALCMTLALWLMRPNTRAWSPAQSECSRRTCCLGSSMLAMQCTTGMGGRWCCKVSA